MKLYRIRDWDAQFENNRSRTVKELAWVAIPNRHDGENYTAIITSKDGAEIFSAWVLMVQVASRCQPRGSLLRGNGTPHDSASLSVKTRAPKLWFDKAIKFLSENTDWIEIVELAEDCQQAVMALTPACQAPDQEQKGMEQKENPASATPPTASESSAFIDGWVQNFKAKFGFEYSFDGGRDGKAVRELMRVGVLRIDLLEIAKQAWEKTGKMPKFFNCEQSVTIHGFKNYLNQIRTELSNGSPTTSRPNPRNIGICKPSTGGDYGEAAKRKLAKQALEAANRLTPQAQGDGNGSGQVLHGDVGQPPAGLFASPSGQ